ncbi:MAG: hypothetical protein IJV47_02310, partial [Candidatus Methanomethylophilaceae archaeon]|nr:hypothetical protein [Candidatus Methanomethylophilaceae archaeon]
SYLSTLTEYIDKDIDGLVMDYLAVSGSEFYLDSMSVRADIIARSAMVIFAAVTGALQLLIVCPYIKFLSVDGGVNKRILPFLLVVFVLFIA